MPVEEVVWAKNSNGRYYEAYVLEARSIARIAVYFPDEGSLLSDVEPERLSGLIKDNAIGRLLGYVEDDGSVKNVQFLSKHKCSFYTVSPIHNSSIPDNICLDLK